MKELFPKIGKRQKLSQIIEENIEELIRNKQVIPGQKLPTENQLCEMFGVSRTSLREALHMLSAKGLISVKKGSGIYVNSYSSNIATDFISLYLETNFDKDYIMHVMKARQLLEPSIAQLAALNRDEEDLHRLNENLNLFKKCNPCDSLKLGELDREFHSILAQSTHNPIINMITDPIFRLMPKIRALVYSKIDHANSAALEYHDKIYNTVLRREADLAYEMMKQHLQIAEDHSRVITENLQ